MNKSEILTGFNNHILEFFNDVLLIFPNNSDIKVANTSLATIKKMNPKLIITIWKKYISDPYKDEINNNNIDFFINRDYHNDLQHTDNATIILQKIDTLRGPVKLMKHEDKQKTITYLQNLSKLCDLYFV